MPALIATAGWSIARADAAAFPAEGTALQRYAQLFDGVEVNSSFHRAHRPSTWARWAASVPARFRFAVKIPKTITHQAKLVDIDPLLAQFAAEASALGPKLAVLLVQLPPKLGFDARVAEDFFARLRGSIAAGIACEPRHPSWFAGDVDAMFERLLIARVAADPALDGGAAIPGGWRGLTYRRLHGSPTIYRSSYGEEAIDRYARQMRAEIEAGSEAWCVFDNTASSAATGNALSLRAALDTRR